MKLETPDRNIRKGDDVIFWHQEIFYTGKIIAILPPLQNKEPGVRRYRVAFSDEILYFEIHFTKIFRVEFVNLLGVPFVIDGKTVQFLLDPP